MRLQFSISLAKVEAVEEIIEDGTRSTISAISLVVSKDNAPSQAVAAEGKRTAEAINTSWVFIAFYGLSFLFLFFCLIFSFVSSLMFLLAIRNRSIVSLL